ncbi:hypothetical protein [Methylobacterium indicum]|uniref:Uncharacterized protein n=1 Tax=Methylobacterium indicum TaxID=1775910 RepID=A0A8H8WST1_9HYPH|nr:hypothetical protein [Methylobacterium indicum]BCM83604.1 hypothetical protein mvi_20650 [Methylobacterium indicum]
MATEIRFAFDGASFSRRAREYVRGILRPALQQAADYLGAYARLRLMAATQVYLDDPIQWTVNAFAYRRGDGGQPSTVVFVRESQAAYLGLEVRGGVRHAGDYATTRDGPLVPGRDATLDENGNLPRDAVAEALAAGARWARLTPGKPAALVLPGRDRLQVLAVIVEETTYRPRFPFNDIVRDAVLAKAPEALAKHLPR